MSIEASFFITKGDFTLDINFKISQPKIVAVYGKSGIGKTTLLRCIAGLERSGKSRLIVNGNLWQDSEKKFFLPVHLRKMGYISQKNSLFPHLTVKENLLFGYQRIREEERLIKYQQIVEWFKIENLLNRNIHRLSGGESQKIVLARSLLTSPEILIMDEPLSALDGENKIIILDLIKTLKKQFSLPILYVSHIKEETDYISESTFYI